MLIVAVVADVVVCCYSPYRKIVAALTNQNISASINEQPSACWMWEVCGGFVLGAKRGGIKMSTPSFFHAIGHVKFLVLLLGRLGRRILTVIYFGGMIMYCI